MGYEAYPKYKYSGVESFGDIPDHWQLYSLKFGLQIPITDGPHETPELLSEGIPFLSAEAVKNDRLSFDRKRGFISEEEHAKFSKKYRPQKGDVYMVKSGATTGNVARLETDEEFNIWSPLAAIRPNPTMTTTDFIFHFMKSKSFFYAVEQAWSFGTQQNIGMGVISNLKIAVPPVHEQEKIGAFLNYKTAQIDRLIEKKQELIEKLQEQRSATITLAVTKGLDSSSSLKDSAVEWLGDVPAHWDILRLRFSVTMSGGMTPSTTAAQYWEGPIPWVTPKDMKSDRITSSIDTLTNLALEETSLQLYAPSQVLIVVRGMILAHTFPVGVNDVGVTVNQDMKVLSTTLNSEYLAILLRGFQSVVLSIVEESAHGTKVLRTDLLKNIQLPVPPSHEQEAIVACIHRVIAKTDSRVEAVNTAIERLQEYRTALITAAVTGQIDVRNWQTPVPAKEPADKEVA